MSEKRTSKERVADSLRRLPRAIHAATLVAAMCLVCCLTVLPAHAHDENEAAARPSAEAQETAGRFTIAALSLIAGVGVYYGMQRHRLMNSDSHPPEWAKKMDRNSIIFAIVAAAAVCLVSYALSPHGGKAAHAGRTNHKTRAAFYWRGSKAPS